MKFTITAVNGGGPSGHQEVRFRSEDGRANGSVNFYDAAQFTKAVQGDSLTLDIDVSGYEEAAGTTGANVPTVTTTDASATTQPVVEEAAQPTDVAPVVTEQAVTQSVVEPAAPTTRRSRTQQ